MSDKLVPPKLTLNESETRSEYAYDQISKALRSGQFRPGEKLTLRGLAKALDISHTPIREAIRQLAAENAIDFSPNRHIRVPTLSSQQLCELRDIRMTLEGMAVERAAARIKSKTIRVIRDLDGKIRFHRDRKEISKAVEYIQEFHFSVYKSSDMDYLVSIIESLWLRTAPYVHLLFPSYSQQERGNLRTMVISALERKDARAARRFIEADICGAMDYIISTSKLS